MTVRVNGADEFVVESISQSMADLCNLLINVTPAEGPMVKGILNVSMPVIDAVKADMCSVDKERATFLSVVHRELRKGNYNLLPWHEHYWGKEKEA